MALGFPTTIRNARLAVLRDNIDAGTGPGKVYVYAGTRPATGGAAGTLLAELTLSDPCGTISNGQLVMSTITEDLEADAGGQAEWFRVVNSAEQACMDGDVGVAGADLNLSTTSLEAGQTVGILSFIITEGNP